jgi:hypothetical protein
MRGATLTVGAMAVYGQATRCDYYFKTRNAAREFRLRIKRWKAEQKYPADTLSFDGSDKRWLAYLRAHVGDLELLPAIVTHWERTAKPITRPLNIAAFGVDPMRRQEALARFFLLQVSFPPIFAKSINGYQFALARS